MVVLQIISFILSIIWDIVETFHASGVKYVKPLFSGYYMV